MKRFIAPLAVGMIALYVTLALGATGCLFVHSEQSHSSHHHSHAHATHSAFCAWACQANPTVSALIETPPAVVFQLVALLILVRTVKPARLLIHVAHSRAPPQ